MVEYMKETDEGGTAFRNFRGDYNGELLISSRTDVTVPSEVGESQEYVT